MAPQLILYRIIGNDLLLDQAGQEETIHAVRFLLDHEPACPGSKSVGCSTALLRQPQATD